MTLPRRPLLALPVLAACGTPLPEAATATTTPDAAALLGATATVHGLPAFRAIRDISVGYAGEWPPVIGRLQPVLTDQGFRIRSEERLLPRHALVAQRHEGPAGNKHVLRTGSWTEDGAVRVRFNGAESTDPEARAAAALVADGYALFLLGPLLLAALPRIILEPATPERITVDRRDHWCDILRGRVSPGLGFAPSDRIALFIDREERLTRRIRFSLDGLDSTRGAVAEVDCWAHVTMAGLRLPTRFRERLLRPLPLRVHDWWVTGLDLNRGLEPADITGDAFSPRAAVPAAPLA
jgi:hypothetical protein